ncbi:hypothetical protein VTN77DRAFT_3191 [Rasamsonia byssochlamydoides]|uniref:uncharacterized protein n=1 Tax=Rasamsonia byssochlamydoides TaxID=89139 RepID=UPI003743E53C
MSPPPSAADTETDTIIVGNGPSAMILSYILHGHIPVYVADPPHPDPLLHAKLQDAPCLLRPDLDALTTHFAASRLSYSTQALPVNVLLDALLLPQGETDDLGQRTNLEWRFEPDRAVPHLVLGDAPQPGGLWANDPVSVSWDIQTLSYAGMLSLPGYSFADHYRKTKGSELPPFTRPTRRDLAEYLRLYPSEAGIEDAFRCGAELQGIERTAGGGFYVRSHGIRCKHLVLATGIFSHAIRPPPLLAPLTTLSPQHSSCAPVPLLVIGSGFTAADVIISAPRDQPILHVFRWDPDHRPSPLRSCHQQAYPEYAGIYRLMKRAASAASSSSHHHKTRRLASTPFLDSRRWDEIYQGLPNAEVEDVQVHNDGQQATVTFRLQDGTSMSRAVCGLAYGVGRRGSLQYLDPKLRSEVLNGGSPDNDDPAVVTGKTLRSKVMDDLEVARDVFIIGSLTGDSLIRFAYGGCVYTASRLIPDTNSSSRSSNGASSSGSSTPKRPAGTPTGGPDAFLNGVDGHGQRLQPRHHHDDERRDIDMTQPLDHRKEVDEYAIEQSRNENCSNSSSILPRLSSWWTAILNLLLR